jgi:hypothetical protein
MKSEVTLKYCRIRNETTQQRCSEGSDSKELGVAVLHMVTSSRKQKIEITWVSQTAPAPPA